MDVVGFLILNPTYGKNKVFGHPQWPQPPLPSYSTMAAIPRDGISYIINTRRGPLYAVSSPYTKAFFS